VQTIIPLPGHGAIRLTTARYYTPSGRSIQAVGIEPDIKVEQSKVEALANANGAIRGEASLHGALHNDTLPPATKTPDAAAGTAPAAPAAATPSSSATPPPTTPTASGEPGAEPKFGEPADDYQLARAIDLLHGLSLYRGEKAAN